MPLPELVKAIIHLKWAVDDSFDGSTKSVNDKLCILTQVFQYGLGLRLGETLRLPIDPLIEVNGEMFCLVWTEKGHIPMARYVPSIWRHPLSEAVAEIRKITQPYRDVAIQIEQRNNLCFVDERLDCLHQEKAALLAHKIDELKVLLELKKQDSVKLWQLKREVKPTERYELKDLNEVLPIASNAKDSSSLITYYRQMGIDIVSESLGGRKHKHYVTGKDIVNVIDELVAKRASNVTLKELLTIINPQRSDILNSSKDKLIKENIDKLYGAANYLTFTFGDEKYSVNGTCIGVVSFENAIKILESYVLGGYDNNRFVSISDFNDMFPELFNITSSSKNNIENILVNKKECFYVKHGGERGFQKVRGYLVDIDKLKNYLISEYIRINVGIESDLLDASIEEYLEDGVEITSKSFRIKQKPSDYLFIRAGMRGGNYFDYLPQILGYNAVNYFFKGNEIQEDAFTRYDISVELHVIESWQSHKGRHWQTTSLFRAGLAELVVNKWMGRTSGQGENYDHNTGRERAKVIGKAMLENTERFLGYVPDKIRKWKEQEIPIETMPDHLNDNLKSVQYSPLGYCLRDLYLKPCEFNLRCLTGNEGKGCKHYIYDLYDPSHRERVTAERDKSSLELSRLLEVYDRGIEAAAMHIEHHMTILRNTTSILEDAELILRDQQLEELQDFMPFKINGSYPDDCPFQCGDSE
ncbi:hypothetical protein [Vibrio parahaemolyticus]|nr:hypothetical protein [Vibrio parahaemolyticus]